MATAVLALIERLLPGGSSHFQLSVTHSTAGHCFSVTDSADGRIAISASDASTLSSGLGFYLRERCNMTIGWTRGGGNNGVEVPARWPTMASSGGDATRCRLVDHLYFMNVCTHSYSLDWSGWKEWEQLLYWMALTGVNNYLAMTGQEEVAYRALTSVGLSDTDVRAWFNGPAFLTWSRGQNEYGAGIGGPLPRSFMKAQYALQKQIVARSRELGIVGQLPGFQGNVPIQLKDILHDANITREGYTGWMDSLDPHFGEIADKWMGELVSSFGTDHWYQLDGYFDGGTAPWRAHEGATALKKLVRGPLGRRPATADPPTPDPLWLRRGMSAYQGLNRTDPEATWSFQGFAVEFWQDTPEQASALRGFITAAPPGKFVIIDMDYGDGEWHKWNDAAYWGAPFVWSALHNFGGTDGLKGNMSYAARLPRAAMAPHASTNIVGSGFTMEGIDQNAAFYELIIDSHFGGGPEITSISQHMVDRAYRRYRLTSPSMALEAAWRELVDSVYAQEPSVQDQTGVSHFGKADYGYSKWSFESDRHTPTPKMCAVWSAWGGLLAVAEDVAKSTHSLSEPLRYDLINVGREVLAQLSIPLSANFTEVLTQQPAIDAAALNKTGAAYAALLYDLDELVGTDTAFMLGPWINMARALAAPEDQDCTQSTPTARVPTPVKDCAHFYEWNARCQITSWNPTPEGAKEVPDGPIDYAAKHWSGLIADYYAARVDKVLAAAMEDAAKGQPLDESKFELVKATHAYDFQVATKAYPLTPSADAVSVSRKMRAAYAAYFTSCA
jgi:alpha-N-acetylglucosaminidase